MMLYDIFLALNTPSITTPFHDVMLSKADLEFANRKAVASYRDLREPSKVAAYKHFLTHCERALANSQEVPLLEVILNTLSDTDDSLAHAIVACERLTQLFNLNFHDQDDVLYLTPMGRALIDRPIAFAAFLRSLIRNGVTPAQLLSSYLLQDFLRYYLSTLNEVDNPIKQLYDILQAFPETEALRAVAKTVSCVEGGLSTYSLDGCDQNAAGSLTQITPSLIPLQFTLSVMNLNALNAIFGVDFLLGALCQWDAQKNSQLWINTLNGLFNQAHVVATQLSPLLNRIQEHPALQQTLAQILDEHTITTLVEKRVGSVLNLIPFCPKLATAINTQDLPLYLTGIRQQASSGAALISSLFALFNGVKSINDSAAKLVFNALLDSLFENVYVLDDTPMIQKLRKFSHAHACVTQKACDLEVILDTTIQHHTQASIDAMDYITIEDVWRGVVSKIQCLQEITAFKTTCPMDKYKLINRLAIAFFKQNNNPFDLKTFASQIGIPLVFEVPLISSYERLLIELLATIDEPNFRTHATELLDTHVSRPWRTALYGDIALFKRAALAGNLGLIQWFQASNSKHATCYDTLIIEAAQANQWSVVDYFHTQQKLKTMTINMLIYLAATQNASQIIPHLLGNASNPPSLKAIEQAFLASIQIKNTQSTVCFMTAPRKPSDTIMAKAFRQAIGLKHFETAKIIAEGASGKCLEEAIIHTLLNAARLNQCDVLHLLSTFDVQLLDSKTSDIALMQATRANQLEAIQSLIQLPNNPPSLHAIENALSEAIKHQRTTIITYLSSLYEPVQTPQTSDSRKRSNHDALQTKQKHSVKRVASCSTISLSASLQQFGLFQQSVYIATTAPEKVLRQSSY